MLAIGSAKVYWCSLRQSIQNKASSRNPKISTPKKKDRNFSEHQEENNFFSSGPVENVSPVYEENQTNSSGMKGACLSRNH